MKNLVFLSIVALNLDCVFGMDIPAAWESEINQRQVALLREALREENAIHNEELQNQITVLREKNARLAQTIADHRTVISNVQRELDNIRRDSRVEIDNLARKYQAKIEKIAPKYTQLTPDEQRIITAYTNYPTLDDLRKTSNNEVEAIAEMLGMTVLKRNRVKVYNELTRKYNEIMQRQQRDQQIFSDIMTALKMSDNS